MSALSTPSEATTKGSAEREEAAPPTGDSAVVVENLDSRAGEISWHNLTVSLLQRRRGCCGRLRGERRAERVVLRNVYGRAEAGECIAIMGSSGAGKSTLLNVLTGLEQRDVRRHADGRVLVDGRPATAAEMRARAAYVQQSDLFVGALTVEEQLRFAAALRLDRRVHSAAAREARVRRLLARMGLEKCARTPIGVPGVRRGVSVGERKRLAFACELLTDPDFLFCDEPTSGLDSFMAVQVVYALHSLAKEEHKTVLTTIHQPTDDVFNLFDKVLFLSREGGEGRVAFFGPPSALLPFLAAISRPFAAHRRANGGCADDEDELKRRGPPNTRAMRVLSRTAADSDASFDDRVRFIRVHYEQTAMGVEERRRALESTLSAADGERRAAKRRRPVGWCVQTGVLCGRSLRTIYRDPVLLWVRLVQIVVSSLEQLLTHSSPRQLTAAVIGAVNFQTPVAGPTVVNLESILYNTARDMNGLFCFPMIHVVTSEWPVLLREQRAGQYAASAYYAGKSLAELPQVTVLPLLYASITYWMSGLQRRAGKWAVHCAFTVLLAWISTSIAYAGAFVLGSESLAQTIVPMLVLPMMLFGGYFVNFNAIPPYLKWLAYASWYRYGFEGLEINQWADIGDIAGEFSRWSAHPPPRWNATARTAADFCPAPTGRALLQRRDICDHGVHANLLALVAIAAVARAVGLVALLVRVRWAR
ncbi:ABC transporter ATP-binding protein/permease wht-1 [Aphelenchoides fujianensis]|nr:ABC transporter ATP-binding protein/permease wht-1 [Aphelenchoides fujianensis]